MSWLIGKCFDYILVLENFFHHVKKSVLIAFGLRLVSSNTRSIIEHFSLPEVLFSFPLLLEGVLGIFK